jgi:hypothetical protein
MFDWLRDTKHHHTDTHQFNGIWAIQEHLDQKRLVREYVEGNSKQPPDFSMTCEADCLLGKWIRSSGPKQRPDVGLLDALCRSCEEFHEAAAQAILLANMGETELAKAVLQDGSTFSVASEELQENMARFHISYLQPNDIID